MATIQIPVSVLDEKCATCKAITLDKQELYAGFDTVITQYQCSNLHLCQYIRGRIVRNEQEENSNGSDKHSD